MLGELLRVLDELGARVCGPPRRSSPRRRVPAIGRDTTRPPRSWTIGSGRGADDRDAPLAEEEHVRAGVHLPQHPVDVERVDNRARGRSAARARSGTRRRPGCTPWRPRPPGDTARRSSPAGPHRREASLRGRRLHERFLTGPFEIVPQRVDTPHGFPVGRAPATSRRDRRRRCRAGRCRRASTRWRQWSKADELAYDRDDGVRDGRGRRAGRLQALDLAHDVVAQIADETPVQRGELLEGRRAEPFQERLDAPEDAVVTRHRSRERALHHLDLASARATSVAAGARPTKENRLQRSPCSTDSRRKPGPSPTMARNAPTGVSVSATSSRQTGTTE